MGFGEWQYETKNKTIINNFMGPATIKCSGEEINGVHEWYYYKNHIIGIAKTQNLENAPTEYFILNELTKEKYITANQTEWKDRLKQKKLNPYFTRWYDEHINPIFKYFCMAFTLWFISLPLIFYFLYIFYNSASDAYKAKFNFSNPSVRKLILLIAFVLLFILKEINFNSI